MKPAEPRPMSVRMEKPLYDALNGLSQAADIPVGKLVRLAVIDYIGRLELGEVNLPFLGESVEELEGISDVIKKYRAASGSRSRRPVASGAATEPANDGGLSRSLAEQLREITERLD